MRALAEFNAMLLLAKNYERLREITVGSLQETDEETTGRVVINNVPSPLVDYFTKRARELVTVERDKAVTLLEDAALKYAKAAMAEAEAEPATDIKK